MHDQLGLYEHCMNPGPCVQLYSIALDILAMSGRICQALRVNINADYMLFHA